MVPGFHIFIFHALIIIFIVILQLHTICLCLCHSFIKSLLNATNQIINALKPKKKKESTILILIIQPKNNKKKERKGKSYPSTSVVFCLLMMFFFGYMKYNSISLCASFFLQYGTVCICCPVQLQIFFQHLLIDLFVSFIIC